MHLAISFLTSAGTRNSEKGILISVNITVVFTFNITFSIDLLLSLIFTPNGKNKMMIAVTANATYSMNIDSLYIFKH
jgi:hypothetical protein